jgi:hypothetical protein
MQINLSTQLQCSLAEVVAQVRTPRLLRQVASPLLSFSPLTPAEFPSTWSEGSYWVRLKLFGVLPLGRQAIVISYPQAENAQTFILRDNGYSPLISKWDHLITAQEVSGGTLYRDRVTIEAGILTPVVWFFARLFYAHRQRRWATLTANGFNY